MRLDHKLMVLTLLILQGCCWIRKDNAPLNVLLIVTDDQGYGDLAFHGNEEIETPTLDRLAQSSAEFTRFYVSPVCAPTRASLLTGRYHLRTGTSWVTHRKEVMRSEEVTIAEVFKSNGYRTGLFGKWHNGKQYPHDPVGQGFETFVGFKDGHLNNYFDPLLTFQFEEKRTKGYVNDIITDHALEFMSANDQPFFTMISYNTPHSPFQVDDRYFDKYKSQGLSDKDASVYGMVENIDDNLQRLQEQLTKTGLAEKTIILFMTDNGPNGWRYNNGLKGRKAHVDEGGVRVPFLLYHPQKPAWNSQKITEMAAHIDVLPTLADMLELNLPPDLKVDGTSLLPLFNGENPEERYFFTHHVTREFDTVPGAVRNREFVLTRKPDGVELYHLINDSIQQNDLSAQQPELVEKMNFAYEKWLNDVTMKGIIPPPIEIGHPQVPIVEFPAPDASKMTNLQFSGGQGWANDWFTGWEKGSLASWRVKSVADLNYEVQLELSAPMAEGQILSIQMGEVYLQHRVSESNAYAEVENRDRVVRGEVEEKVWPIIPIGTMMFKKGSGELTLKAESKMDSLIAVKSIKLIPLPL